ncbi:FadR/GntR family transcriptional regulator [Desulfobacula sp.]|uniref:FadR/GntR family transcriptional regulator n=1 Tax=Desulfobacula sp. TaxID=2593537 RepID=UPI00262E369C|nr:FadR/GntR family transcriptional regulator [Desulfobacula sp.]
MLKKVRQVKLYEDIANQIEEEIISGEFKPGDKLPSERDLEEIFGASRGTIRQSFRILEQKGIIEIRTGAQGGAFVREITPDEISKSIALLIRFNFVTPDHIAKFREGIEGSLIANLAAQNADQKDVQELKAMLEGLIRLYGQKNADWPAFDSQEQEMHILLGKMTKNPLYEALSATIMQSVKHFPAFMGRNQAVMEEVIKDWKEIIDCLKNNNSTEAEKNIQAHILKWVESYKKGSYQP